MQPLFQAHWNRLDAQWAGLFAQLKSLPPEKLLASPPGQWNALEVVAHLIAAERTSLQYMQKKSLGIATLDDSGFWETLKIQFLILTQRLPLRYKAPRVVLNQTGIGQDLRHLEADRVRLAEDWTRFLHSVPSEYSRRKIYRHVFAGRLDLGQALQFVLAHFQHHQAQLRRLLGPAGPGISR
ncbi:MAG: DinB family protein [Cyclobacteriaceae bacterium]|nr:DinB family protein [Cyclobacteriaceae bacterium]